MPQFGFYPSQIFWLIVSFGILFVAMRYFLLPPLEAIIKQREDQVHVLLDQAQALNDQAENLQKEYQQEMDATTQRSTKRLSQVNEEVAVHTAEVEEEMLQSLQQDIKKAQTTLKNKRKNVLGRIEAVSNTFIQSILSVFYNATFSQKELSDELKKALKGADDVK